MNNLEIEKKQRGKLISIIVSMVVVIALLVTAVAMVAIEKANKKEADEIGDNGFTILDDNKNTETKKEQKVTTITKISTETSESLPTTGATDLTPLAFGLGAITTAATAIVMKKRGM